MGQKLCAAERELIEAVWAHYRIAGRHDLPWRRRRDPYRIAVSELMLQQTQVARVVPKYRTFIRMYPTTARLAQAPVRAVLTAWQGLGYNRRAKMLHDSARIVHTQYAGRWPRTYDGLLTLPGIGPYTAGAISAFAYDKAVPLIETNIRTVYLHHLFPAAYDVSEVDIQTAVSRTMDTAHPREWYWALMDYGAHLKQLHGNNITRARTYRKQSPFAGSVREVRGAVVSLLTTRRAATPDELAVELSFSRARISTACEGLCADGLLIYQHGRYRLPG